MTVSYTPIDVYKRQIELFVRYCKTLFERFSGKVKYWILVNQINLFDVESFTNLGIPSDRVDNLMEAKYQALHHELVACGQAIAAAREINPDFKLGVMPVSYTHLYCIRVITLSSCFTTYGKRAPAPIHAN